MGLNNTIREKWSRGQTTQGMFCSIGSSFSAEIVASAGYDYACVDLQHGALDYSSMLPMLQAIAMHDVAPFVRVSWCESWMIMQALDAGATGVIVPMIDTADDAAAAVSACRYPPHGTRSFGPTRVSIAAGTASPDDLGRIACVPMIETEQGYKNLDRIAATPGVDGLYVGPGDLALSMGLPPRPERPIPEHEAAIRTIREACLDNGIVAGIHCTSGAEARRRREEGFVMISVGNDAALLKKSAGDALMAARATN